MNKLLEEIKHAINLGMEVRISKLAPPRQSEVAIQVCYLHEKPYLQCTQVLSEPDMERTSLGFQGALIHSIQTCRVEVYEALKKKRAGKH